MRRVLQIASFCLLSISLSSGQSLWAQEKKEVPKGDQKNEPPSKDLILDKLLKAKEEHGKEVEKARKKLLDAIEAKLQSAADRSDLKSVDKLQEVKDTFEQEDQLPTNFRDATIVNAKGEMDTLIRLANAKLIRAYDDAIRAYTKARNFDSAKAIEDERKEFTTGVSPTKVTLKDQKDGSGLKNLVQGATYLADRHYMVAKYPREMHRAVMLVRPAEHGKKWLAPFKVLVSRDCFVYAAIQWEYNGEVKANEAFFNKLAGAGWTSVEGRFEVTAPANEVWNWKVLKKKVKKGPVDISRDIDARVDVLFLFK